MCVWGKNSQSIRNYLPSSSGDFHFQARDFKVHIMCSFENSKDKPAKYDQVFTLVWYHFDRRLDSVLLSVFLLLIVLVCPWPDLTVGNNTVRLMNSLLLVAVQSEAQVCGRSVAGITSFNPAEGWMFILCVCCVGSDLCEELITHSPESNWVVTETLTMGRPSPKLGCCATPKKNPPEN